MNEQKEKRRNIHRTRDDDERCQVGSIPLDLTLEILSRLPLKSIFRFLCVSKLWSSFVKLPSFIKTFTTHSSARPRSLVVTFSVKEKRFVYLLPQEENPDGSYPPVYSYQMTNNKNWTYVQSECVHGLVLFHGFVIWNQAMRRFLNLPEPKTGNKGDSYLGYDPLEGKHKVLYLSPIYSEVAWIRTLGAQESWRIISKPSPFHRPFGVGGGRCFNGIMYHKAVFGSDYHIMSFDVRSEKFKPIKFPRGYRVWSYPIVPYEGRMALVNPKISAADKVDLLILKDEDGHEWMRKHFILPSNRDKTKGRTYLNFHGVTDAGELIFTQHGLLETFYILYLDLKRNNIREAWFEGIAGDEFRRRYGLGYNNSIQYLDVFSNHMESLVMSL